MASLMHLIPILMNCSQPSLMRIMVDARILDILLVATIQITLGDDSQCTVIIVYLTNTDLGDDSQCTRGKAVQLQIKYLSR